MGKKEIGHSPDAEELFDRTQTFADWCKDDDNLLLVESWTRDGYTITDIANRLGISPTLITRARREVPEFDAALRVGRELVDYKVENALLRVALGYKTKEVKVTTTMRYGKVVETIKEVTEKEQAPNVSAIQTWLYNRQKDKWRNMSGKASLVDELGDDTSIEITVKRASDNETEITDVEATVEDDGSEARTVEVRKRTPAEKKKAEEAKAKQAKDKREAERRTTEVIEDDDSPNLDEWPEDWEDEDEDS